MEKKRILLCEGVSKDGKKVCPLKDSCAFYCVGFNKSKTDHFAWMPYNLRTGKCDKYQEKDIDSIIVTTLNKRRN